MDFHRLLDFPLSKSNWLGVAIGCEGRNMHCGILHRSTNDGVRFLHLAWQFVLKNDDDLTEKQGYCFFDLNILEPRARQIAAICRNVYEINKYLIPYSPMYDGSATFDDELKLVLGDTMNGLTCSTFVLTLFKRFGGLKLLDIDQWPQVGDDVERDKKNEKYMDYVIRLLRKTQKWQELPDDHIESVENERGTIRFRPDEVVAGCTHDTYPAPFDYCEEHGKEILDHLIQTNAPSSVFNEKSKR